MALWREIPTRSAKGAMIGILVTACPEPEGIRKLIRVWTISMAIEESHPGRLVSGMDSPYTTVSIMWPGLEDHQDAAGDTDHQTGYGNIFESTGHFFRQWCLDPSP